MPNAQRKVKASFTNDTRHSDENNLTTKTIKKKIPVKY